MENNKKSGLSALTVYSVKEIVTMRVVSESLPGAGKRDELCDDAATAEMKESVRTGLIEQLSLSQGASDEDIRRALNAKREEKHAAIDAAVESGDYEAWRDCIRETRIGRDIASVVTKNKFQRYREMQESLQKAKDIAEELGLPPLDRYSSGKGHVYRASTLEEF